MPQKTLFAGPKTFKKDVIKPGVYWPRDADGKPYRQEVSLERINHWAAETKRLLDNGSNIPMPYVHTAEAVPWLSKDPQPGSYQNGATLKDIRVRDDGMLEVELEAEREEDAKRIGKTVKDVSFRAHDDWTDGNGKKYKDVFTHVALVNHPIVVGQKNFVPTGGLALSLSMAAEGNVPGNIGDIGNPAHETPGNRLESVLALLKEHGLALPEDTDEFNFIDHLNTALTAVKSYKEMEGEDASRLEEPPTGSKRQQPAPLAMATDQELQFAINTLSAGPENPGTKSPWTLDEIKAGAAAEEAAKPKLEFSAEQQTQINAVQVQAKMPMLGRIRALVEEKRVSPTYAQEKLIPLLDKAELTFSAEGEVLEITPLHIILDTLEEASKGAAIHNRGDLKDTVEVGGHKFSLEQGLKVHKNPKEWTEGEGEGDDKAKKTADRMAAYVS